jgi:hypothetical protein
MHPTIYSKIYARGNLQSPLMRELLHSHFWAWLMLDLCGTAICTAFNTCTHHLYLCTPTKSYPQYKEMGFGVD